ncbi:MAG: RnfH family protein [Proteobacteria bacterium]|nr:RnfH family protein [Pseudomonadota bacterium]
MRVQVVCALPARTWRVELTLPRGATAAEALAASNLAVQAPDFDASTLGYAVFGKPISAASVLREGDRLELLRPLRIDPKQARRRRAGAGD